MALRRGRNIESLLANRSEDAGSRLSDYGEQGREVRVDGRLIQEYFTARGKPKNYQYSPSEAREAMNYFKAIDKSKGDWEGTSSPFLQGSGQDYSDLSDPIIKKVRDKQLAMIDAQMMDKGSIGEFEGKEIAEMNAVLADPESSPPIQKIGSLLSAEGESSLDQAGRDMMDRRKVDEEFAAMENPPEDSYGDKLSSYLGQAGDYVTGLFSSEETPYMSSENLKGENRYLNKLAREEYRKKRILGPHGMDDYQQGSTWGKDWEGEEESTLDRSGLEAKILKGRAGQGEKFDLDPQDKMDIESSFWERTKQGRVGDAFSGLFSSDDSGRDESLANETKDNEALAGKIGAAAKLFSLLQPEQQQAAPTIPTARITRGSVAFPGMKLASQRERRKYYTPKGLMA